MMHKMTVSKLIGLKKQEFNDLIRAKEIQLTKPRLIPLYKLGDEMALTSVLLSALRLIKEFRLSIFSDANIQRGGSIYYYTEVSFKDFPKSRIDGMILVVKAGTIREAIILEVKNGKDELNVEQIERYQELAKHYSISKFITISNQFVTDPTQSPVTAKNIRGVDRFHFSWSYILTIAHVLLFKNDNNIEDEDQVELMREVVNYFEAEKSGILGLHQMKPGWLDVVEKINAGANLKVSDDNVHDATLSWQQEERDMALKLSRELGVLVSTGTAKYKGKLEQRLKDDRKELVTSKQLSSTFRVRGAASDIEARALFEKKTVEMSVGLKPPFDKTLKGQLGWLSRQFDNCAKKEVSLFKALEKELHLEILIKKSPVSDRFPISNFDHIYNELKGREIREIKIIHLKDFGRQFSSRKKFVDIIELMLIDFYKGIVQHLVKWEPPAPKIKDSGTKQRNDDDEAFIDEVNSGKKDAQQSIRMPEKNVELEDNHYETEKNIKTIGSVVIENDDKDKPELSPIDIEFASFFKDISD